MFFAQHAFDNDRPKNSLRSYPNIGKNHTIKPQYKKLSNPDANKGIISEYKIVLRENPKAHN